MTEAGRNAAIVRRTRATFHAADIEALTETFDERASWHTPGRSPVLGDAKGRQAIFAQFGRYRDEAGGTFRAVLREVLASDRGRVVGVHRNTANHNGRKLDSDCCIVFELENGVTARPVSRRPVALPRWTTDPCLRR